MIINLCQHKLSESEFVLPIQRVIPAQAVPFTSVTEDQLEASKYAILSGTPIHDFAYLEQLRVFEWLRAYEKPVLGICAGMQVLGLVYGGKLVEKQEIGMKGISTVKENRLFAGEFDAYNVHGKTVDGAFEVLAKSEGSIQAIKVEGKEQYGIMFHPEVRNVEILKKFTELVKESF